MFSRLIQKTKGEEVTAPAILAFRKVLKEEDFPKTDGQSIPPKAK